MECTEKKIGQELFDNRQSFLRYNHSKICRSIWTFKELQRMVFLAIPRLLHVNQKYLPGYVNDEVPAGICNYKLDQQTQAALEYLFPQTVVRRNSRKKPVIQTLLLVGSVGSIAQTRTSDLDYTLLIDKNEFTQEQLQLLSQKLRHLENWAWQTCELEIHFFINDVHEVKANNFGESDSESSGSALGKMLKEEIYRTGIIVAGKIPYWLILPVETDDETYEHHIRRVQTGRTRLNPEEFIDIGNVDDISPGEFFGSSIWTLIKSFTSPFKTLLKMGLLEDYMSDRSKYNLLCHEIKSKVFSDDGSHHGIDPYLILFERVQRFFIKTRTENELDALRTAFYLKAESRVTVKDMQHGSTNWKISCLTRMIRQWGWSLFKIEKLNDYNQWQMMQKAALGEQVNKILIGAYKNISDKIKTLGPGESLITEKDTHLLGRKLSSYYRKAEHKVENLFALIDGNTAEQSLTFLLHPTHKREKGEWYLVRGKTPISFGQIDPKFIIKKARSLEFLIAFVVFNHIYNKDTKILLRDNENALLDLDFLKILNGVSNFFSKLKITNISNAELMGPARIKQLYVIPHFGYPFPWGLFLKDIQSCKNEEECSRFISKRLEHLRRVTSIYLTSWGEFFCKTYSGVNGMNSFLEDVVPHIPPSCEHIQNFLKVCIPTGRKENFRLPWINSYILRSLKTKTFNMPQKVAS